MKLAGRKGAAPSLSPDRQSGVHAVGLPTHGASGRTRTCGVSDVAVLQTAPFAAGDTDAFKNGGPSGYRARRIVLARNDCTLVPGPLKLVAGAGIEPAHWRLMRPLPSHLAPPRLEKWHSVSVLPRARGVLETLLRKLAPAVLWVMNKWSGQPDLHRHPLNGVQEPFSWTMTANERRGP